jgi:hypothetical protein
MFHLPLIAALAIAAPGGHAAAPTVHAQFDLRANHGLRAHVSNDEDQVSLEFTDRRQRHYVNYEVPGEVTEHGLEAHFGRLGTIEVSFESTKATTVEPPRGCKGEPSTSSEGIFVGRIDFSGERHYVRIDRARAKGEMNIERGGTWSCPRHRAAIGSGMREEEPEGESGWLKVYARHCICVLEAIAERDPRGRGKSFFFGGTNEGREGMRIIRVTTAQAGPSTFLFDHADGTATIRPPAPFSGHGHYERRRGRDLWSSTIQVPLLGAAALKLGGHDYSAVLRREVPGGE